MDRTGMRISVVHIRRAASILVSCSNPEFHCTFGDCLPGSFPAECRYVLETLGGVYANDAVTKEEKMTPVARLEFHRQHSQTPMDELENWMREQFSQRKVFRPGLREPNSGLGKAITYMQRHWKALTLFLRQPGAPLDNNICERALKLAVLHRKNALFYRTLNGAQVGDLFMSLIRSEESR